MSLSPYFLMQKAVDIVGESQHPTNKIAAVLSGVDQNGQDFYVARTNFWPDAIARSMGIEAKIGNSSGTVHAETACIIDAPMTRDSSVFVTDLPCPNCVKNMVEAGVKTLYIDHKGFAKDYAQRRGYHFSQMALRICEQAGVSVYKIWRKEERLEPVLEVATDYDPPLEAPAHIESVGEVSLERFAGYVQGRADIYGDTPFAAAVVRAAREAFFLSAETHPILGYTYQSAQDEGGEERKYSFFLEPVNRMITNAARKGLKIDPAYLYASRVPSSREFVNMMGAHLDQIYIDDQSDARDEHGLQALEQLKQVGALKVLGL